MLIGLIMNLICGGLAGWVAGNIMNSEGSLIRHILLGLCGGVVGTVVLGIVGIKSTGRIGSIIISIIGACILIWVARKLKK